jgi:hypothetical protein
MTTLDLRLLLPLALSLLAGACGAVRERPAPAFPNPLLVTSGLAPAPAPGDAARAAEPMRARAAAEEERLPNRIGVFAGATDLVEEGASGSYGIEYERRLSELVGVGFTLEFTPVLDERTVIAPGLMLHAWRASYVEIAPGLVHDDEDGRHLVLRLGVGWEHELGGGWSIAPQLNFDWVEGADDALVIGLALSRSF